MYRLCIAAQDICIKITPLTEGEQEKQYVSLTLVISLPEGGC